MRLHRWAGPLAIGLAVVGMLVLTAAISSWIGNSPGWAYDFNAYFDAAQRLATTGSPYQSQTLSGPFRPGPYGLYLYAPPLAILFMPLTALGDSGAVIAWLGLRVALMGATCAAMPVSRNVRIASFGISALSAPFLFDLNLGNVSLIVTFFGALVWRWLDRPIGGVALAAALTLRPTMALIAAWWIFRGVWKPVAVTIGVFALIAAATLPFVGFNGWFDYLAVLRNVSDVTGVKANVDVGSAVLLLSGSASFASIALFAGYGVALAAMALSLRRDRELSYVVTLTATVVLAPLLWDHYLTILIIPAAFLASRGRPWGFLLPLACWLPTILFALFPALGERADAVLPFIAFAGLVLPFIAADRGEPAVSFRRRAGGKLLVRAALG